jgi:rSAM-associated Gly-rich repeat protein
MAFHPRSGLFGFLLILGALAPSAGMAASIQTPSQGSADPLAPPSPQSSPAAPDSVEARLQRISAALRQRDGGLVAPDQGANRAGSDGRLALTFVNGGRPGWVNGGFRNGGFRNGGWVNGGGWRNGGGFINGGNGGAWRNGGGGWRNYW